MSLTLALLKFFHMLSLPFLLYNLQFPKLLLFFVSCPSKLFFHVTKWSFLLQQEFHEMMAIYVSLSLIEQPPRTEFQPFKNLRLPLTWSLCPRVPLPPLLLILRPAIFLQSFRSQLDAFLRRKHPWPLARVRCHSIALSCIYWPNTWMSFTASTTTLDKYFTITMFMWLFLIVL